MSVAKDQFDDVMGAGRGVAQSDDAAPAAHSPDGRFHVSEDALAEALSQIAGEASTAQDEVDIAPADISICHYDPEPAQALSMGVMAAVHSWAAIQTPEGLGLQLLCIYDGAHGEHHLQVQVYPTGRSDLAVSSGLLWPEDLATDFAAAGHESWATLLREVARRADALAPATRLVAGIS